LIFMVEDPQLELIALSHYIRQHDKIEMLTESPMIYTLNYEINKDVTLRSRLGDEKFNKLVLTMVHMIRDTDKTLCVPLLDKIKERKAVLETLILISEDHLEKTKPQIFCSADASIEHPQRSSGNEYMHENKQRVLIEFRHFFEQYRKEGLEREHGELFYVLRQLDVVAQAFEFLSTADG